MYLVVFTVSFGGTFALCFGGSLISLVELFYFLLRFMFYELNRLEGIQCISKKLKLLRTITSIKKDCKLFKRKNMKTVNDPKRKREIWVKECPDDIRSKQIIQGMKCKKELNKRWVTTDIKRVFKINLLHFCNVKVNITI